MAGIFKSYDIRGTVPDQLSSGDAYRIGRAASGFFKQRPVAVARDARIHAPALTAALISGLNDGGSDVIDLGMGPTPLSYFAAGQLGSKRVAGAVMCTASHNPADYGGFKFTGPDAKPISYETGINQIEELYRDDKPGVADKRGKAKKLDLYPAYCRRLRRFAKWKRTLKIAVDGGNGVIGARFAELVRGLPLKVVPLYFKPDGRFPNHEANPLKLENLRDLQEAVRAKKCDVGVAFDGDGDRVAFVDETGRPVPGDLAGVLMARVLLAKEESGIVFYDIRSSRIVAEAVRAAGGTPLPSRIGHSHIKAALRAQKAVMAAELSGHYYFRDFFHSDSGETAMFLILSLLGSGQAPLSAYVRDLRRYHHSGEHNFHVAGAHAALAALEKEYGPRAKTVEKIDGVTFDLGSWWFNLRPSNTEPVVRLNLESLASAEEMNAKLAELTKFLNAQK